MGSDNLGYSEKPSADKKKSKDPKKNQVSSVQDSLGYSDKLPTKNKNSKDTKKNPTANQKDMAYDDGRQKN
jgi:hypothetical protein